MHLPIVGMGSECLADALIQCIKVLLVVASSGLLIPTLWLIVPLGQERQKLLNERQKSFWIVFVDDPGSQFSKHDLIGHKRS